MITPIRMGVKGSCHTSYVVSKKTSPHDYVWAKQIMLTCPAFCFTFPHACMWNFFEFPVFKMFYLLNEKSDWRSVFIIKSITTRSSKLDLISICFNHFFWGVKSCHGYCTWIVMVFTLKLPWYISAIFSSTLKTKFWHIAMVKKLPW